MKVLLAYGAGKLEVVEMERPIPGPDEVLAKVVYCGVCATDIAIADGTLTLGDSMDPIYPVRLGHEWSGVVVETGSDTFKLKKGDHIISDTSYSCGKCEACLSGEYQACEKGRPIGTIGHCWPGAFAEYMLIPERIAFKVPPKVSLKEAALVEPASIGLYGLLKANLKPEQTLLVVGTGPIGLGGMACAKGMGAGKVILAGRKHKKLEIGKKMGADVLVNTTEEDLKEVVKRETNDRGADVVLDTTGSVELFNDLLLLMCQSGTIVIPGFYERAIPNAKLDRIIARNCTLIGAAATANVGKQVLSLIENGHVSLLPMLTEEYKFEDVKKAFGAVKEHNDRRVKIMVGFGED